MEQNCSPRKRAKDVLDFVAGPKRKKNVVKELLNFQLFLHKLIAEEDDPSRVEEFLSLFGAVLVSCLQSVLNRMNGHSLL